MLGTRCSSITCIYGGKRIGHEHAVGSNRCSLKRGILGSDWHPESRRVNGLRFEITSKFRTGGVDDQMNSIRARADASGNLPFYSTAVSPAVRQTFVTSATTPTSVKMTGISSTSRCSMAAGNALAAAYINPTYIHSKTHNEIVIYHQAVAGMIYDVVCTAY
jgi:hypothetical protein